MNENQKPIGFYFDDNENEVNEYDMDSNDEPGAENHLLNNFDDNLFLQWNGEYATGFDVDQVKTMKAASKPYKGD